MIRKQLTKWKSVIDSLQSPKDRPNDFQRLVLSCLKNNLNVSDAVRIFGISQPALNGWLEKYDNVDTLPDQIYFMQRARQLGADDEAIAGWFGLDRADKVSTILAEHRKPTHE